MEKRRGSYIGTEISGKWWKRYRGQGFFARGNGEWWLDDQALHFRRYLIKASLVIPFEKMTSVRIGTWHAGKWIAGRKIVKVSWTHDGLDLNSGFYVSNDEQKTLAFAFELENRIGLKAKNTKK